MNYKEIVQKLSLIRTKKNLSARELSLMLGKSESYFYKIERHDVILSVPMLLEILEALELKTEEFFYDDFSNYEKDRNILEITKSLSKEEFEALVILLKRSGK